MKTLITGGLLVDGINYKTPTAKDILLVDGYIKDILTPKTYDIVTNDIYSVNGNIITAGLMDLHVHSSNGFAKIGCLPDDIGAKLGSTTIFDAGTYGADNFDCFYEKIIKPSNTKVYAWLNVASCGLTTLNELNDMANINEEKIINTVLNKYPSIIVGLKVRASASVVGNNGIKPVALAKNIATKLKLPLMIHIGNKPPLVDEVLALATKGDIITHCCHNKEQSLWDNNTIRTAALKAKERGVLFDIGHGNSSFSFDTATKMIQAGFKPDFISTDIYDKNIQAPVKSQLHVISKLMLCGLSFAECIAKTTYKIAELFNLKNIGRLEKGYIADLSLIKPTHTSYSIEDSVGVIKNCNTLLQSKGVFINGKYYKEGTSK